MTDSERSEELENLMNQYGDEIKRFCTLQLNDPFQAEDTTVIQIQALPEYGSAGELNNLPAISVEW